MLPSKNNFLDHVKWIRQAVQNLSGEMIIAGDSMQAFVRLGQRHWTLYPRFMASGGSVSRYTSVMTEDVTHFAGWLPYRDKRWPLASDKLLFKRYAAQQNLRAPAFSTDPDATMTGVIVKRAVSSFGDAVQGPFRQAAECPLKVDQGDYYERFIEGRIVKAWFWNGKAQVMELDAMPRVKGDGVSSLGELIERRARASNASNAERMAWLMQRCEIVVRYFGRELTTVLPAGVEQLIEFRYGSDLMNSRNRRVVDLRTGSDERERWASLIEAGRLFYGAIPEPLRAGTLFTVDAVRDAEGQSWLLEMNSHPTVHPLAYPAMMESLMAAAAERPDVAVPLMAA